MALAETARARRQLVEDAGWSTTSWISILAGTLVAFGAVVFVAAAVGAAGSALGLDTNGISTNEWRQAGVVAGAVGALVILGSFFLGGYTAGRMSRRAGAGHGLLVFLTSIVLVAVVAAIAWGLTDNVHLTRTLEDNGVPTDRNTWNDIGLGSAIAAAIAMLLGSVAGGIRGDRWHGRLATAVVEHRDDEIDKPVDRTQAIDLRHPDDTISIEEEREQTRTTMG
jgi:hypothetical protein